MLVIGYGSIGCRHADALLTLGHDVAVVSRRRVDFPQLYKTSELALNDFAPDYIVIASRTNEHRDDIQQIAKLGFTGKLMIEKPVYQHGDEHVPDQFARTKIAFNLRFHPALQKFRALLKTRTVHAVTAYAGSYLPDWRPNTDYRKGYSAIRAEGGGVLRDLSHELDYLQWIFGKWQRLSAIGGNLGSLEIDSDDVFSILFETQHVPLISLSLNYLDTTTRRDVIALTDSGTVRLDLVAGTVEADGKTETFSVDRNDTYFAQHNAMIENIDDVICDLTEGLDVMRMINAAEDAARSGTWVHA